MFNKDLIYICKHVEEWPTDRIYSVRLDNDGEICFLDYTCEYDFYPEGKYPFHDNFVPDVLYSCTGYEYPKEEFLACKQYLSQQDNPSVAELQDVVSEKVISRIKESQSRHREAYNKEITPLLEVLQRRGVNCDEFTEL